MPAGDDDDVVTAEDLAAARERWQGPEHEPVVRELFGRPAYGPGFRGDVPLEPGAAAFAWDEGRHPRVPAGSPEGGEFAPAAGGESPAGTGGLLPGVRGALSAYVSGTASAAQKEVVARAARQSVTKRKALVRVSKEDKGHRRGDVIDFEGPVSFTGSVGKVLAGAAAGDIGWKSSDRALYYVEAPARGLDVDYAAVRTPGFSAAGENETVLSGRYRVKEVRRETEPGTRPQDGYTVPLYLLEELGAVPAPAPPGG